MKKIVLIGYPLEHSLSPVMHNAALKELELEDQFVYEIQPLQEQQLSTCIDSIGEGDLTGANVTIPYKTKVIDYLTIISDEASRIGSVNTLYREGETTVGCNTDVSGFIKSIEEHSVVCKGISALVIGAGGAARAISYGLVKEGVSQLKILNRSVKKAESMINELNLYDMCEVQIIQAGKDALDLNHTDLVVNCTPLGMKGHSITQSPVRRESLHPSLTVVDLVYNPRMTKFLQEAKQSGCKVIDGTGMLVHQGAEALELWIGEKPPIETMRKAVIQELGGHFDD